MAEWDEMSERERDAWLAQHLFNWTDIETGHDTAWGKPADFDDDDPLVRVEDYTTDISAAWQVVEHIHANIANVTTLECDSSIGRWTFSLAKGAIVGVGETAPLAITHAAYLAVEGAKQDETHTGQG